MPNTPLPTDTQPAPKSELPPKLPSHQVHKILVLQHGEDESSKQKTVSCSFHLVEFPASSSELETTQLALQYVSTLPSVFFAAILWQPLDEADMALWHSHYKPNNETILNFPLFVTDAESIDSLINNICLDSDFTVLLNEL